MQCLTFQNREFVFPHLSIARYKRQSLRSGLRDKQPVKRIFVKERQYCDFQNVGKFDRKYGKARPLYASLYVFGDFQLAFGGLNDHLPYTSNAYVYVSPGITNDR